MTDIAIVAARRTPQARFLGAFTKLTAVDLALAAGEAALSGLDKSLVDLVIIGNVLAAGQGMSIARQIGVKLGIPLATPAYTVNMMCGSGLQSVLLGAQAIRAGEARVVVCGGTESMSQAPHLLPRSRTGLKLGDGTLVDVILRDGLVDSFHHKHMGETIEALASEYQIGREEQDEFALLSQSRYAEAHAAGRFQDELVPLAGLKADEHPRPETTFESLTALKPAFLPQGTITAGNASGINDGAAIVVLASREVARQQGWRVLAWLEDGTSVGCDPLRMGVGPVLAMERLLARISPDLAPPACEDCTEPEARTLRAASLQKSLESFDRIEINEAFAGQVLVCLKDTGLAPTQINTDGGAIALGHPIGASGARLLVHQAWQVARGEAQRAMSALCVGGGMGIAAALRKS